MMKILVVISMWILVSTTLMAQNGNPNTLEVKVDGKEYKAEPRRITVGNYAYLTGNAINPDKSLRFWLGSIDGSPIKESGTYLVIGERDNYKKNPDIQAAWNTGKYKGITMIRYVEETKSPRMEHHVGDSEFDGSSVDVQMGTDGYLNVRFNANLKGTWWKEKSTATVFGGIGRLTNKMEDKAVTGATGYDQNIDPEGMGYKMQKETDTIKLTEGAMRYKMN